MVGNLFADMWLSLPTNKKVGLMLTNDPDGIAANNEDHGCRRPSARRASTSSILVFIRRSATTSPRRSRQLKANNCEIACGIFNPPQFVTFWTQCAQQGYRPKIMTPPKALLFPSAVEALGDRGTGTSTEVWWSQHHPFKSGLTGQTAQQFCDAYTAATGKQWTQPIGFKHANIEVAIDVLKRAKKLDADDDPRRHQDQTDYNSLVGPLTWKGGPTESRAERVHHAAGRRPVEEGQEASSTISTSSTTRPRPNIPLDSPFEPI